MDTKDLGFTVDVINEFKGVVEHLRKLGNKEIKPKDADYGICAEMEEMMSFTAQMAISRLMSAWPLVSDRLAYPVPHPYMSAVKAFYFYSDDIWADDEYGDNRRALCLWLADEIDKMESE